MNLGDLNIFINFFLLIFFSLLINTTSFLNLLLTAELLWVTLYLIVLIIGLIFNNLNLLALTFFFLIFSAIELSIGLIILLLQNLIQKTTNLNNLENNFYKFNLKIVNKLYINKIKWKI